MNEYCIVQPDLLYQTLFKKPHLLLINSFYLPFSACQELLCIQVFYLKWKCYHNTLIQSITKCIKHVRFGFCGDFQYDPLCTWVMFFYSFVSLEELLSSSGFMLLKKDDYIYNCSFGPSVTEFKTEGEGRSLMRMFLSSPSIYATLNFFFSCISSFQNQSENTSLIY